MVYVHKLFNSCNYILAANVLTHIHINRVGSKTIQYIACMGSRSQKPGVMKMGNIVPRSGFDSTLFDISYLGLLRSLLGEGH